MVIETIKQNLGVSYLATRGLLVSLAATDGSMAAGSADIRPPWFGPGAASCLKFDMSHLQDWINSTADFVDFVWYHYRTVGSRYRVLCVCERIIFSWGKSQRARGQKSWKKFLLLNTLILKSRILSLKLQRYSDDAVSICLIMRTSLDKWWSWDLDTLFKRLA